MTDHKLKFKGRFLKVAAKKTKLPNGHSANLEMVEHPGAVMIIPFLTRTRIILLRQFRPVINATIYELPAGTLEKGEKPSQCARREVIEETGYAAKKLTRMGKLYPVPGYSTEKIIIFKAEGLTEKQGCCEEDEIIETLVVTKDRVKALFKKGEIVDAKTICGLAMIGWL